MQILSNGPTVRGKDFEGPATIVPYELLKSFKPFPTPFSLSSQTVTLGASASAPLSLWAGDDLIHETKSITYTFTESANTILSSAGVETTGQSAALGIWYFYLAISKDFTTQVTSNTLIPSQTAPAAIDFEKNTGYLGHPGTSATKRYVYVGHVRCTNTTGPAFTPFTKKGYNYSYTEAGKVSMPTTSGSYTALAFTGATALPAHNGVKAGGYIETSATSGDTIKLAQDANGTGVKIAKTVAAVANLVPFSNMSLNSGDLFALHGTAEGDVHVTELEDII